MSDLVAKLRAVDHMSVEDCFLQSPLFAQAADRIEELENADLPQTPWPASEWALAEITRLQKELETAREALEPFAEDDPHNLDVLDDREVVFPKWSDLTAIHFRRAREVYRNLKDKEVAG